MRNISEFIEEERKSLDGESNNLFSSSMGVVLNKYKKMLFLRSVAIPLINEYGKIFADLENLDPKEIEKLHSLDVVMKIEVLFESFLMYGSILCDDIARLFLYYFGDARNIKLKTHRKLAHNFPVYAEALSLEYDNKLAELAIFLEKELCDFRDKELVHDFHPRKLDSVYYFNDDNDVRLGYGMLNPKTTDQYNMSKSWGEILEKIELYLDLVMEVISKNKDKTRFLKNA